MLEITINWSSHNFVIRFTAHFITEDLVRKESLLQAAKFNKRHTGDNIVLIVCDCPCQWDIQNKLLSVLRDGASNNVVGLCDSDVPNLCCLVDTFQLVINDGVLAQKDIQDLLTAGRRTLGHY